MNKISINIEMPEKSKEHYRHQPLCEKVREYMNCCESDNDSEYHWKYLTTIYNKLKEKSNLTKEYKQLLKELEEFMLKHSVASSQELDSTSMFKYLD